MKKSKKSIILLLTAILFLTLVIYTEASNQGISKKLKGIFSSDNGLLISEMSEKDKIEISKSFDKETKKHTKKFDSIGYDYIKEEKLNKNTKEIKFIDDWNNEKVLKFNYVIKDKQPILLPLNEEEYYISSRIPKKSTYILQYNYSLYLLDIDNAKITTILKDKEKYKKNDLKKYDSEDFTPIWGENPCISPDGDKLTYYTNRSFLTEKDKLYALKHKS